MRAGTQGMRVKGTPALSEVDAPRSVEALTAALSDPDLAVKAAAGLALASLRDPASIGALAVIVAGWDHPELARARRAALHTLIAFRTQEAAVELARALATAHPAPLDLQERSALLAVAYAEQSGVAAPRVVRALVAMLACEEHAVAERATSLLMLFPTESHGPLSRTLRTASAPEARRRAAQALGACRQDTAEAALVTALADPSPAVRAASARSLDRTRDPASALAQSFPG
jgi:HEAT repeat protein